MNLPTMERQPDLLQPEVEPMAIVQVMPEGYSIEKNPEPLVLAVPETDVEALENGIITLATVEGESPDQPRPFALLISEKADTAVTGEDRDAVNDLLANDWFIGPFDSPAEQATTAPDRGKNALQTVRNKALNSKVGMLATSAIVSAGLFSGLNAETAQAQHQAAATGNVPTKDGSAIAARKKMGVGKAREASNGIHYLGDEATFSEVLDPTTSDTAAAPGDIKELKQDCTEAALAKPKIVKAAVLHVGRFDIDHGFTQSWFLSTRYKQDMPEYCNGLYARANRAKAQAFHNGHWVDEGDPHNVSIIPETGYGNWEDIGNVKQLYFPVCKARIILKASVSDLGYESGNKWSPHRIIARRTFPPIPAKILPHKPKAC